MIESRKILPDDESDESSLEDPESIRRLRDFRSGLFSDFSSASPDFEAPVFGMMLDSESETKASRSFRLLSASRFFSSVSNDFRFSCSRSTRVACWHGGQYLVKQFSEVSGCSAAVEHKPQE